MSDVPSSCIHHAAYFGESITIKCPYLRTGTITFTSNTPRCSAATCYLCTRMGMAVSTSNLGKLFAICPMKASETPADKISTPESEPVTENCPMCGAAAYLHTLTLHTGVTMFTVLCSDCRCGTVPSQVKEDALTAWLVTAEIKRIQAQYIPAGQRKDCTIDYDFYTWALHAKQQGRLLIRCAKCGRLTKDNSSLSPSQLCHTCEQQLVISQANPVNNMKPLPQEGSKKKGKK